MDIDKFLDEEATFIEKEPVEKAPPMKEAEKYEELFEEINSWIKKNDLEQAEKVYYKLWLKIAKGKFTWQPELYDNLVKINERLRYLLNTLYSETREKINIIRDLITRIRKDLKEKRNESALSAYSEIIDIYNEIPSQFSVEKRQLYLNEILPLYRELRYDVDGIVSKNFNTKVYQINNLIRSTRVELQKKNVQAAVKFYKNCLDCYNALPSGFFLRKIELGNRILELYKELTIILQIEDLKSRLRPQPEKLVYRRPYNERAPVVSAWPQKQPAPPKTELHPHTIKRLERPISTKKLEKIIRKKKTPTTEDLKRGLTKIKTVGALSRAKKEHTKEAGEDSQSVLRFRASTQETEKISNR
jgi:hypothetical protein